MLQRMLGVLLLALIALPVRADVPPTMTRVVVRRLFPVQKIQVTDDGIRAGMKMAHSRITYSGAVQAEMIVVEPDVWFLSPDLKEGQHSIDQDPDQQFHWHVFPGSMDRMPQEFRDFEHGREVSFFDAHGAKKEGNTRLLDLAGFKLHLDLDAKSHNPTHLKIWRKGFLSDTLFREFEYLSYATNIPFDAAVFKPPVDFKIEEKKPDAK